jgi:hypothetical protein
MKPLQTSSNKVWGSDVANKGAGALHAAACPQTYKITYECQAAQCAGLNTRDCVQGGCHGASWIEG